MNFAASDLFLPVGMAIIFAGYRYTSHYKVNPNTAFTNAFLDGIKGAFGLSLVTLTLKYFGIA